MTKGRLEAFSDGVLAIVITIMVLELHVPEGEDWEEVKDLLPEIGRYALSFLYIAIYWNNHHHLLQGAHRVNGLVLWANMHLLFWLSLVPLLTVWVGRSGHAAVPTATYGAVLFMAGLAYFLLSRALIAADGEESHLAEAVGRDRKGLVSMALYLAGIPLSLVVPWVGYTIYIAVAVLWLVPDRRIEGAVRGAH